MLLIIKLASVHEYTQRRGFLRLMKKERAYRSGSERTDDVAVVLLTAVVALAVLTVSIAIMFRSPVMHTHPQD